MTNRVNGLFVSLDKDYRDDDVEVIVNAVKMIKGVTGVGINIVNHDDYFNRERLKYETKKKLIMAVKEVLK